MSRISLHNRARHFNAEQVRIYSGRPLQGTFGGFLLIMVPICENDASVRYEVILREKYPYSVRNRHLDLVQLKATSLNDSTSVVLEGGEGGIHLHPREIYFLEIEILEKDSLEEELAHALSDRMSLIRVDAQHVGQQSLLYEDYLFGSIDIKPSPTQEGMFIITLRIRGIELGEAILSNYKNSLKRKVVVADHRPFTYFRSVPAGIYSIEIKLRDSI